MKYIYKGVLYYFMILCLIGVLLFGIILISIICDFKFTKINLKKMRENEGFWLMLLCFLCCNLGLIYSWKELCLRSDLQIEQDTIRIYNKIIKRDKESVNLLHKFPDS